MELNHQLQPYLKQLRLSGILETLDTRHRQAVDGQWSYVEFLSVCLKMKWSAALRNNWLYVCAVRRFT